MNATHADARTDTLILINPAAARAAHVWRDTRAQLLARRVRFEEHITVKPGDAAKRTRRALQEGYRTIVALGGDGTLSETASGFFTRDERDATMRHVNPHAALAILPAGTGDDFARGLIGKRATLAAWLERFINYHHAEEHAETVRRVDVLDGAARVMSRESSARTIGDIHLNRFICLNAATLGLGAEVAARVARQGRMMRVASGEARFALAAIAALARWRARPARITVDDAPPFEVLTNLLAVMNGRFAGGGMMFSPTAQPDDAQLDVVSTNRLTRPVLLRELTRIHRGGHIGNPAVRLTRGARVRIEIVNAADCLSIEADGDVRGTTPVEFRVLPKALRVVV